MTGSNSSAFETSGRVGAGLAHDSAFKHTTGEAIFLDDAAVPHGCLHAHLVLSPWAHARITEIDVGPALDLPGVHAALTRADIPGVNNIAEAPFEEPLLPELLAEYIGHPLAAIAAETPALARRAADSVRVQGNPLAAVKTLREAYDSQHWLKDPVEMRRGSPETEIDRAPIVLEGELEVGGQDHFYLETQVALAIPQEDRDMMVLSSTQHPSEVQHIVARLLDVPQNAVTVEVRRMGGAFGGKESQATLIAGIAAVLARKSGRPVKLRLDRDTDMNVTGKRHNFLLRWKVGVKPDGRILAVDMDLAAGCGWSMDLSAAVISRALSHADNAYFYPHVRLRALACKTNTQSNTAFRGFGGPQGMIGAEAMIDQIARALKIDPLEVRRRNFYRPGTSRDLTPYHQRIEHFHLPNMVEQIVASSDYAARRRAVDAFNASSPVIRKGLALSPVKFGISFNKIQLNQAGALVHVYTDGSIRLNHGGTEMGQGLYIKVAQVVAEVFSVPMEQVKITATTTDKVPNTSATAASSGSDLNGMAALEAAENIKQRLQKFAAERFDVAPDEIVFDNGLVRAGNHLVKFAELVKMAYDGRISLSSTGFYRTPDIHFNLKTMQGSPFYYFAQGVAVSEVAIDTLSGEWKPLRTDILHDVGSPLNPAIDLGQIEGGFIQGLGWLTMEELVWDKDGRLRTHAPSTYKIPTARDLPADFRVDLLADTPNKVPTVFRSKAVGEPPLMLAISVWLALRDAVTSLAPEGHVLPLHAPATPERILRAVTAARTAMDGNG